MRVVLYDKGIVGGLGRGVVVGKGVELVELDDKRRQQHHRTLNDSPFSWSTSIEAEADNECCRWPTEWMIGVALGPIFCFLLSGASEFEGEGPSSDNRCFRFETNVYRVRMRC